MNETQAEYDTYPDTFPQPLVQRYVSENGTDLQLVEDRPGGKEVAVVCSEYADLLGTAAGAAQEAKEMGYDPQKTVEALPEILKAAEALIESSERELGKAEFSNTRPKLLQSLSRETIDTLKDALASAEGSDDE